ncbi:MAG: glucosidase [Snowella sp.]|nr:glucosidase [Snowella sp.]
MIDQKIIDAINGTAERKRLIADKEHNEYWKRWGPYLSDRQWGTVREDYSEDGDAWEFFPHDHARSRVYRWGEDGILGISDNHQRLCFALTLWNGQDTILKERLFGLTNREGNHGEDVKEYYFYLDNTPTHSYMKGLYKYPQSAFPYEQLVNESCRRKSDNPEAFEFELLDTGVFNDDRYFDVFIEYAKKSPEDILIQITIENRSQEEAELHLAPTLWFRNTWSWNNTRSFDKPSLHTSRSDSAYTVVEADFANIGLENRGLNKKWLYCEAAQKILYTENETNRERFNWGKNSSQYVKDGINDYIVNKKNKAVNVSPKGTKAAAYYRFKVAAQGKQIVRLRLSDSENLTVPFGDDFSQIFAQRKQEAEEFYQAFNYFEHPLSPKLHQIQRQAFAGLLWSKQFYHYVIEDWLKGDTMQIAPPSKRQQERNSQWTHLFNEDIISMPDKWEYPWYAVWDLAFHTIPLALIDPEFAKKQLYLFTREWYMHPNGQIPAYEWNFSDVNPPVHAWAAWRVYQIERKMYGKADRAFLEEIFLKLNLYFTWWVNRKDLKGNNLFGGGFLGLDNIGVFDRSNLEVANASIEQSDGTSWMGMFCLNMLKISTELAKDNSNSRIYNHLASKYLQHFLLIADSLNHVGDNHVGIWDDKDNFYYDVINIPDNALEDGSQSFPFSLKVRSMVGLIPLFAIERIDKEILWKALDSGESDFKKRFDWFINNRQDLIANNNIYLKEDSNKIYLSLVNPERLHSILTRMLDESEFFSPYGIRSLSKIYEQVYEFPFEIKFKETENRCKPTVKYEPAESSSLMFGGNSNWRGPIWFPVNYLIIESLQKFHLYLYELRHELGYDFQVNCPTHSVNTMNLWEVATEISERLIKIFLPDEEHGDRPVYGGTHQFQNDPNWNQYILFYEYFHGDIGAGIGASHQTGWTGLIAKLIQQYGEYKIQANPPI